MKVAQKGDVVAELRVVGAAPAIGAVNEQLVVIAILDRADAGRGFAFLRKRGLQPDGPDTGIGDMRAACSVVKAKPS